MARARNGDDVGAKRGGDIQRGLLGDERVVIGVDDRGGAQKWTQLTRIGALEEVVQSGDEEMVELRLARWREMLCEGGDGDEGRQVLFVTVIR